jgi:preprotein translocase subunit SecD
MRNLNLFAGIFACFLTAGVIALSAEKAPVVQIRLASDMPSPDSEPMNFVVHAPNGTLTNLLYVQKEVLLDETAFASAKLGKNQIGQPVLDMRLTAGGAKLFAELTRQHVHERLAIIVCGEIRTAPVIAQEIRGGKLEISGGFTEMEAEKLATKIEDALKEIKKQ